jgi:YesN/AraC family two-component response regulator
VIWIEQGAGEICLDLQQFEIREGSVYYIKPGQAFSANIAEAASGIVISFAKEFLDLYEKRSLELYNMALFNHCSTTPVITVEPEMYGFIKNITINMLQEFDSYLELRAEVLKGFLKIFIIYLSRHIQSTFQSNYNSRKMELLNIFYTLLEKHYATKKMVRDYADILAVTPNYLNDTVKEMSGFTASYHIQQRIVLEAKRRAIFNGDSMKQIAYCLGFCDPAHFSKYFKNSSGTNFTDFKKTAFNFS